MHLPIETVLIYYQPNHMIEVRALIRNQAICIATKPIAKIARRFKVSRTVHKILKCKAPASILHAGRYV